MRIALSGKICSGKTTVAEYLELKYGFTRVSLADPLKELVAKLWGVDPNRDKAKYRQLLVSTGEHLCLVDQNVWVDYLIRNLPIRANVVVDDVRKPQEYNILKEAGFYLVRIDITATVQRARVLLKYPTMPLDLLNDYTETALDPARFDIYLDGDLAFRELKINVAQMLYELERRERCITKS